MVDEYTITTKKGPFGILTEVYCDGNFVGCVGEKRLPDEISKYAEAISSINDRLLSNNNNINELETIVKL